MTSSADIRLRALEPEDLELIYRIENDPAFWQFGCATVPYSRYAIRQYLETTTNDLFKDEQVRLVIEYQAEGEPATAVGLADLFNFDAQHLRAEIGLAILPEHQGKHVGGAAVEALCAYARTLHLHQLYATIATTNKPATRLFERLGFKPSAVLTDWLRMDDGFMDAVVWQQVICRHDDHLRDHR